MITFLAILGVIFLVCVLLVSIGGIIYYIHAKKRITTCTNYMRQLDSNIYSPQQIKDNTLLFMNEKYSDDCIDNEDIVDKVYYKLFK